MANRSYLYRLSNQPTSYEDRPDTISGISEWAYDVPFIYRLLVSGDPQICASLIADGLDGDEPPRKTRLHAISSPCDVGVERVKRFVEIVRWMVANTPAASAAPVVPAAAAPAPASFLGRLKKAFSPSPATAPTPAPAAATVEHLPGWLDATVAFLDAHRDTFFLLETIEIDTMMHGGEGPLRACVEAEIARCRHVGAAFEALPTDTAEAARVLRGAASGRGPAPFDAFFGLRFDDDCDNTRTRTRMTEHPIGLTNWSEVLYFGLFNRAEFDANRAGQTPE
ncbi:MAG: hypothetical protein EOP81_00055 [Variovorax sp.]|nr:MAG: hypothetical protein EOP81_00055 [Variovorax sp.]